MKDTNRSLRIAVVTSGRFHVCDLARELFQLGHDVTFYSLVPPWRTKKFGIPTRAARWVLPRIPVTALRVLLSRGSLKQEAHIESLTHSFSKQVASIIEPCDVVIGMSGMCNALGPVVKRKFGAALWIERGSRHILSQKEIMEQSPKKASISNENVEREIFDYEQADTIVVLSKHCEESFVERGVDAEKLFRNPLGVDLKTFYPSLAPRDKIPKILMTGTWCWRKGCDLLVDAWKSMKNPSELMHVGPVGDLPLPTHPGFIHYDRVEQSKLVDFYRQATVFALASREEGLATVQPQALACGLRLVCTNRTGGEDLLEMIGNKDLIDVVPSDSTSEFRDALDRAITNSKTDVGTRHRLSLDELEELSWRGCARRYSNELVKRIKNYRLHTE